MNSPLSLQDFTTLVGQTVHGNPALRDVWVVAELSDVTVRGGHFYADLIQKDEAGRTVAKMRANLWASRFGYVRAKYYAEREEELRNGIKIKMQGSATHHNQYGLSFNITDIDPTYIDEGDILRRRMEILKQLTDEGVVENNKLLPLDIDAQRVAVISAPGAAGLGDFIAQLSNNAEGFRFCYKIFESPMQGERAAEGVINALARVASDVNIWDCVVIIRGGGATADMNCFDNLLLARNVCYFEMPVIVGIGHERDNCVLDYIAHTRCKTPTAVAEFLINHQREAWKKAYDTCLSITREATLRIEGENRRLSQFEAFIPSVARQLIEREKLLLKNFTTAIPLTTGNLTTREHARLEGFGTQLLTAAESAVARAKDRLLALFNLIEVLKPENTLKRGYSITRIGGKALREAASIKKGAIIETQLADGILISEIKNE